MITVGLVDDHGILRACVRQLLATQPDLCVVGEAADSREALALVREHQPQVLVLDISLPGPSGLELCRVVRQETSTRVVILTMHLELQYVRAALAAEADAYVIKHAASEELALAIRKAARGERFVSAALATSLLDDYHALVQQLPRSGASSLPVRQREVLQLLAEGQSTKQIALALQLSPRTVEAYRAQVMAQTGLRSVAELTKYAIRTGLTSASPAS